MDPSAAIEKGPPPDGSYQFVMRRYDRACDRSLLVAGYSETCQSRAVVMNGVEAQTVFLNDPATRDKWLYYGWKDETEAWFKFHRRRAKAA